MTRQIKFRVWAEDAAIGNKMMTWDGLKDIPFSKFQEWGVVMQSTDLFDKNGKEIYEGDIVEYQYLNTLEQEIRRAEVQLMPIGDVNRNIEAYYPFCYSISGSYKERDREITECYLTPANDCEIIGNIYENSDLLAPSNEKKV